MSRELIHTAAAPKAIGPYSQAVRAAGLLYTSGQIAIDPSTGEIISGGIAAQAKQVLENLQAVLEAGGASLSSTVKTTIYLADMNDFSTVNNVYAEYFGGALPARATIEVARLPKDALVEIEAIAIVG